MPQEPETLKDAAEQLGAVAKSEVKAEVQATKAKAETVADRIEREVETWFNDLRQNLAGLETETHNRIFALKEALKARLRAHLS